MKIIRLFLFHSQHTVSTVFISFLFYFQNKFFCCSKSSQKISCQDPMTANMALGLILANLPPRCLMHQKPQSNCFPFTCALLVATFFKIFFFSFLLFFLPSCVWDKKGTSQDYFLLKILFSLCSPSFIFSSLQSTSNMQVSSVFSLQLTFSIYWFHGTNSEKYFLSDFREVLWKKFIPIFI